jgi:hypothetical protein
LSRFGGRGKEILKKRPLGKHIEGKYILTK